eukprot:9295540-Alexandrium_andersonii.AAC.1
MASHRRQRSQHICNPLLAAEKAPRAPHLAPVCTSPTPKRPQPPPQHAHPCWRPGPASRNHTRR